MGYENFDEAQNGKEAYNKLEKGGFDFAIVDWNMPELTGIELVHKIKANDALKNVKILMLTAESEKEKVIEAIRAGVNNYIIKPFSPDMLEKKIREIYQK